jgi:3-methyladenine DNA glycosylase AlkC
VNQDNAQFSEVDPSLSRASQCSEIYSKKEFQSSLPGRLLPWKVHQSLELSCVNQQHGTRDVLIHHPFRNSKTSSDKRLEEEVPLKKADSAYVISVKTNSSEFFSRPLELVSLIS